ncbi:MAG: peptidase MA family metallohydrolase [Dehalococcoidales bacterium]
MIKKAAIVLLSLILMTVSCNPFLAQSSSLNAVKLNDSIAVSFPDSIRFNLGIETDIAIKDVRLHFFVERANFSEVTQEIILYVNPLPQRYYEFSWEWDMRTTGTMPSGTVIRYWWSVIDISDNLYLTEITPFSFNDGNYNWQNLNENNVSLYWYQGSTKFAAELMETCQDTLLRLGESTGSYLEFPIRIYIYSSSSALRKAMLFAKEWTGGVAYPAYGVIAIGISTTSVEWGKRALAHEIAHLVTHQMTSNPYNSIPIWLNEGISMYAEGDLESEYEYFLKSAVTDGTLLSVQSLCSPFSAAPELGYLSYAESYSLVAFLIEEYGQAKIHELLRVFKNGSTYDNAFLEVYGFDLKTLNTKWHSYISGVYAN